MEPQPITAVPGPVVETSHGDEPAKLESSAPAGCTLAMPAATDSPPIRIRVRRDGVAFASDATVLTVRRASATLGLPLGTSGEVAVSVDGVGAHIEGFVARAEVPLHVRPSHRLAGGVVTATPDSHLEIVTVEQGSVKIRLSASALAVISESAATESVPCDDLGAAPFDRPVLADGKPVSLDATEGLEVRASSDGPPMLTLHAPPATVAIPFEATKLGVKGKLALVEIPGRDAIITGWVPTARVHVRAKPSYGLIRALSDPKSMPWRRADAKPGVKPDGKPDGKPDVKSDKGAGFECKAPIAIAVPRRVGALDELVWVGTLHAETVVASDDDPKHAAPNERWRAVRIRDVSANVPIFVRADSLAACMKRL